MPSLEMNIKCASPSIDLHVIEQRAINQAKQLCGGKEVASRRSPPPPSTMWGPDRQTVSSSWCRRNNCRNYPLSDSRKFTIRFKTTWINKSPLYKSEEMEEMERQRLRS